MGFFAPQGRSAEILITILLLFLWNFCPAGPLRGNLHDNFITFKFFLKRDALCPLPDSAPKFSPKQDASRSLAPSAPTFVPETGHFESLGYFGAKVFLQTGLFAFLGLRHRNFPPNGILRVSWRFGTEIFPPNGTLRVPWRRRCLNVPKRDA